MEFVQDFFFLFIFNPSESIFVCIVWHLGVLWRDEILSWTCSLPQQSLFLAKVLGTNRVPWLLGAQLHQNPGGSSE